VTIVTS